MRRLCIVGRNSLDRTAGSGRYSFKGMTSESVQRPPTRHLLLVLGLAVIALAASVLRITPKLVPWHDHPFYYETIKVEPMLEQFQDPAGWDRPHRNEPDFSAIQTLRWRLLPPVFGRLLRLSPHAYLTLPWIGAAWLVVLAIHYALKAGASPAAAAGIGILAGTSSAFFSSTTAVGYFDSFYVVFLVLFTCSPWNLMVLLACFAGPWIDEKFLFMLPACAAARWCLHPGRGWLGPALLGLAPYCIIRLAALRAGDDSFARQLAMQGAVFRTYAPALPEGWWYGFRAGWVLIGIAVWHVSARLAGTARAFFILSLAAAVAAVSFLAWDTTRSIAMLAPFLVLAAGKSLDSRFVVGLAALNLLLPAAYVWCGVPITVPLTSILFR